MERVSLTLTNETLEYLRSRVASGEYASESDVIEEGLQTMRQLERDSLSLLDEIDQDDPDHQAWEEEIGRRSDECKADPSILMTSEEVEQSLASARTERMRRVA